MTYDLTERHITLLFHSTFFIVAFMHRDLAHQQPPSLTRSSERDCNLRMKPSSDELLPSAMTTSRNQIRASQIFFDGTYLPTDTTRITSVFRRTPYPRRSRPILPVAGVCCIAVLVMFGVTTRMMSMSQSYDSLAMRQLRSRIAKVATVEPVELQFDSDTDTNTDRDTDADTNTDPLDMFPANQTENDGNYMLDLFLEVQREAAKFLADTSDTAELVEGKDSTGSEIEIVFEEESSNVTMVASASSLPQPPDLNLIATADEVTIPPSKAEDEEATEMHNESTDVEAKVSSSSEEKAPPSQEVKEEQEDATVEDAS